MAVESWKEKGVGGKALVVFDPNDPLLESQIHDAGTQRARLGACIAMDIVVCEWHQCTIGEGARLIEVFHSLSKPLLNVAIKKFSGC